MTDPDVPLLADLDAGLLDPDHAREVRRAAEADPRSAAVLDALAATRADLAAVPAPVAPPDLVAGWLAALAAAPSAQAGAGLDVRPQDGTAPGGPASDVDSAPVLTPDRPDPADRPPATPLAGGAVPGGLVEGGLPVGGSPDDPASDGPAPDHGRYLDDVSGAADPMITGRPAADPTRPGSAPTRRRPSGRSAPARPDTRRTGPGRRARGWVLVGAAAALVVGVLVLRPTGPPDVTRVELAAVARSTVGTTELGEFTDPARRDGCLATAGHAGARLFGGREVRLDGVPGVLLVLSTGELGVVRALVLTPECVVLADEVVGR